MLANAQQDEDERLRALRALGLLDTPPSEAFDRITRMASQYFGVPISAVSLTDEDRQWFKSRIGVEARQIPRDKAPCAQVANHRDLVVVPDLLNDATYQDSPLAQAGVRFYAGAPLVTREGFGLGSMCVLGTEPRTVTTDEVTTLKDLAAIVMAQIELQHAFGRMDPVSDLPNCTQLMEDLEDLGREQSDEERVAVLVSLADPLELVDVRRVLGPSYVDDLVKFGSKALRSVFDSGTPLYHVGSTDLLLILNGADQREMEEHMADVQMCLAASVTSNGIPIVAHPVIGVAPFKIGETPPVDILRTAYGAALDAREAGIKVGEHSSTKDEQHRRRFALLSGMREALSAPGQLRLVYQPRIDIVTGRCVGAEALLRWEHPNLGNVPPAEFVPLVERTALIGPLTDWVIGAALSQSAAWRERGLNLRVSVNVSAANLEETDFVDRLRAALDRYALPPQALEIEFTESALMRNRAQVLSQLARVKACGVTCAIDDFGSGYSSFSYLQDIPAEVIKIDRAFIPASNWMPRDQTVLKAMVTMAHELNYRVVAEGVEAQEALDRVAEAGCDEVQGYFFARPLEVPALEHWLASAAQSGQAA
jgi:EAL domain-containing protein (putative c-di-GMP-specific phosphodiesterase class I)/GGDEF domain-containing protein